MTPNPHPSRLAKALGLTSLVPVTGGDFATAYRAATSDGRTVFVKTHSSPPPDFFTTEATGLAWMRKTATVSVPEVLAVSDSKPAHLMMEWVEPGRTPTDDATFGQALAAMHRISQEHFGRPDGATTGSLALPNPPTEDWAEFFWSSRLEPLLRIADEREALPAWTIEAVASLENRLDSLIPDEPPALVHGDLWAGNRIVDSSGRSWLIDPATHHNHREWDLAMMALFGGFGPGVVAAYREEYPLAPGYDERIPLFQLPPLIVHAIKFGGGYAGAVAQAVAFL